MTRLVTAALVLAACPHRDPEPPRPLPPVAGCVLTVPPPAPPKVSVSACEGFEACFSLGDAALLNAYLGDAQAWMRDAWVRCGAGR